MEILLGIFISGILFKTIFDYVRTKIEVYILYIKPIKNLLKIPIKEYNFVNRKKNLVKLELRESENIYYVFYITLSDNNFIIYKFVNDKQIKTYANISRNKKYMTELREKILTSFNREINENVINIGTEEDPFLISKNIVKDTIPNHNEFLNEVDTVSSRPDLNDILDKINETGINSLTKEEFNFLKELKEK